MTDIIEIPKSIIKDKDKKQLSQFMKTHYSKSSIDTRLGFDNMLKVCRETVKRQKNFAKKAEGRTEVNAKLKTRMDSLLTTTPDRNKYLLEDDTSKWPWDYERIVFEKAGVGLGSCYVRIKENDRLIAVDRETAAMFFV